MIFSDFFRYFFTGSRSYSFSGDYSEEFEWTLIVLVAIVEETGDWGLGGSGWSVVGGCCSLFSDSISYISTYSIL